MLVWILFALAGFFSPLDSTTGDQEDHEPLVIEGRTMGTTYRVIYFDPGRRRDFSASVDSLLVVVNEAINTYNAASDISRFNKEKRGICMTTPYLYQVLKVARKIHDLSDGAFDPTVMPLVNAWGFGPQKDSRPSPQEIDSLRKLVGFDQIKFSKKRVWKTRPHVQLDMGGIGQGFGADVIAGFLKHKGIRNMLVELGGEGVAFGKNLQKEKPWTIGILNLQLPVFVVVDEEYVDAFQVLGSLNGLAYAHHHKSSRKTVGGGAVRSKD